MLVSVLFRQASSVGPLSAGPVRESRVTERHWSARRAEQLQQVFPKKGTATTPHTADAEPRSWRAPHPQRMARARWPRRCPTPRGRRPTRALPPALPSASANAEPLQASPTTSRPVATGRPQPDRTAIDAAPHRANRVAMSGLRHHQLVGPQTMPTMRTTLLRPQKEWARVKGLAARCSPRTARPVARRLPTQARACARSPPPEAVMPLPGPPEQRRPRRRNMH